MNNGDFHHGYFGKSFLDQAQLWEQLWDTCLDPKSKSWQIKISNFMVMPKEVRNTKTVVRYPFGDSNSSVYTNNYWTITDQTEKTFITLIISNFY